MNTRPQDDGVRPVSNRIVEAEVETDVETDVEVDSEGDEPDDERPVAPASPDGFRLGGDAKGAPTTERLIPPMLERFIATDRAFAKARKTPQTG